MRETQDLQCVDFAIWFDIFFAYFEESCSSGIKHFGELYYLPTYLSINLSSFPFPQY